MVQVVHVFIERLPMDEPMHPVEMKFAPEGDDEKPRHKPDRIPRPFEPWDVTIGEEPHREDFVAGPDHPSYTCGPEYIVVNLVAKKEETTVFGGPIGIVFLVPTFAFFDVEVVVKPTVVEPHHDLVSQPDLGDPAKLKIYTTDDLRLGEIP